MNQVKHRPIPLTPDQAKAFRRRLLAWYRTHRRDLPWRPRDGALPNAYHTLVSEAMLQQTQVATVVPYFHRFIAAFPTVAALAQANEQRVLTLWQGLGYYRRARNLHAAAKMIVEDFNGEVPSAVNDLLKLPGVGRYTAGAISSIGHGTRAALVDGNVERVFARLFHLTEPINAPATKNHLWSIAEALVPPSSPGDYNQALMELGALVCTPKLPKCFVCPVREHCRGVQETNPETLPIKLAKKKPTEVTHMVFAVERNGKYLFEQRPSDGLWSNMWQLPTWEPPPVSRRLQGDAPSADKPANNPADNVRVATNNTRVATGKPANKPADNARVAADNTRVALQATANMQLSEWVEERFGLLISGMTQAADFTHPTTHRTIRFVLLRASVKQGRLKPNAGVWRGLDQIDDLPMSNPQRRVIELLTHKPS